MTRFEGDTCPVCSGLAVSVSWPLPLAAEVKSGEREPGEARCENGHAWPLPNKWVGVR